MELYQRQLLNPSYAHFIQKSVMENAEKNNDEQENSLYEPIDYKSEMKPKIQIKNDEISNSESTTMAISNIQTNNPFSNQTQSPKPKIKSIKQEMQLNALKTSHINKSPLLRHKLIVSDIKNCHFDESSDNRTRKTNNSQENLQSIGECKKIENMHSQSFTTNLETNLSLVPVKPQSEPKNIVSNKAPISSQTRVNKTNSMIKESILTSNFIKIEPFENCDQIGSKYKLQKTISDCTQNQKQSFLSNEKIMTKRVNSKLFHATTLPNPKDRSLECQYKKLQITSRTLPTNLNGAPIEVSSSLQRSLELSRKIHGMAQRPMTQRGSFLIAPKPLIPIQKNNSIQSQASAQVQSHHLPMPENPNQTNSRPRYKKFSAQYLRSCETPHRAHERSNDANSQ